MRRKNSKTRILKMTIKPLPCEKRRDRSIQRAGSPSRLEKSLSQSQNLRNKFRRYNLKSRKPPNVKNSTEVLIKPSRKFASVSFMVVCSAVRRLTTKLRHSRPLASDLPTEAFNGCCLERLVRRSKAHKSRSNLRPTISRSRSGGRPCHCAPKL